MTADDGRGYVDALSLSDVDTAVYESVANLEYAGGRVTRGEIAATVDLDGKVLDETLDGLVNRGLLLRTESDGEPAYAPAERGWTNAPEQKPGLPGA